MPGIEFKQNDFELKLTLKQELESLCCEFQGKCVYDYEETRRQISIRLVDIFLRWDLKVNLVVIKKENGFKIMPRDNESMWILKGIMSE